MTLEAYDQPEGSGTNYGQSASSLKGGVYYFQDCPLDADHLASGELRLRFSTLDFPGVNGPFYESFSIGQRTVLDQLPTPVPVGSQAPLADMAPSD
jgi:hypothetical protein